MAALVSRTAIQNCPNCLDKNNSQLLQDNLRLKEVVVHKEKLHTKLRQDIRKLKGVVKLMKRLMRTISDDWIEEEEPQEEQPQGVNKEPLVEQQREHQEHRADKQQGDLEEPRELRKPGELKKRKLKQNTGALSANLGKRINQEQYKVYKKYTLAVEHDEAVKQLPTRLPQNPKVQLQKGFPIIPIDPANFTTKSIPVITKLSSVVDDSSSAVNKYSEEQVDQEINTPEKMDAPGEVIDPEQAPVKHSGDTGGGSEELEPDCPSVDAGSYMTFKEEVVSDPLLTTRQEQTTILKEEVVSDVDSISNTQDSSTIPLGLKALLQCVPTTELMDESSDVGDISSVLTDSYSVVDDSTSIVADSSSVVTDSTSLTAEFSSTTEAQEQMGPPPKKGDLTETVISTILLPSHLSSSIPLTNASGEMESNYVTMKKELAESVIMDVDDSKPLRKRSNNVICPTCRLGFTSKASCNRHQREKHTGAPNAQFRCEICSKSVCTQRALNAHFENVHSERKKWKCGRCNKVISTRYGLIKHKETPSACDRNVRKQQIKRSLSLSADNKYYVL